MWNNYYSLLFKFIVTQDRSDELDDEKEKLQRKVKLTKKIISWIRDSDTASQWETLEQGYKKNLQKMNDRLKQIEQQSLSASKSLCLNIVL